jgi:hypothetical protein
LSGSTPQGFTSTRLRPNGTSLFEIRSFAVKKMPAKIDRATLLKGGGTAALTALLVGALEGRAEACCFPIDLSYGDGLSSLQRMADSTATQRRVKGATEFSAIRIWAPAPGGGGGGTPRPTAPWTLLFTAANASVAGFDENQNHHGTSEKAFKPKSLGGTIYVFVK